jgi:hypothetical protein
MVSPEIPALLSLDSGSQYSVTIDFRYGWKFDDGEAKLASY